MCAWPRKVAALLKVQAPEARSLLGPPAKPRLWRHGSHETWCLLAQPRIKLGKGLWVWVVTVSREDKEKLPVSFERGSFLGPHPYDHEQQGHWHLLAVLGTEGQLGSPDAKGQQLWGKAGLACPSGKNPSSPPFYPVTCPLPAPAETLPLPWLPLRIHREMAGSLGVEMSTDSHTGHGSGNGHTRTKEKTPNSP